MALTPNTNIINGILSNQPANVNFLSPLGFTFTLKRSPNLNFYAVDANIPSLEIGAIKVGTPFSNLKIPGDRADWGSFRLTFKVDEDMANYLEIFNWIVKLSFPDNFSQYASIASMGDGTGEKTTSDATLSILNSSMNSNIEVIFRDIFPVSISDVNFTATDTTVNYVTATVEFNYTYFTLVKV
jgi:hypothetical protein